MKFQKTHLLIFTIFLISCSKTEIVNLDNQSGFSMYQAIWDFVLPDSVNTEGLRIVDDVKNPDFEISIIDNPNYGLFSSAPEEDIYFSGKSPTNISVTINGIQYNPDANGQWLNEDIKYKTFFGQTVQVTLSDGSSSKSSSIYIPKQTLAAKLSSGLSINIARSGNNLKWNVDPNNTTGYVALVYYLYDDYNADGKLYDGDMLFLKNNGNYNIDNIIADVNCKKIYFKLINGNTISEEFNGQKVLFHISSVDHHEYYIN